MIGRKRGFYFAFMMCRYVHTQVDNMLICQIGVSIASVIKIYGFFYIANMTGRYGGICVSNMIGREDVCIAIMICCVGGFLYPLLQKVGRCLHSQYYRQVVIHLYCQHIKHVWRCLCEHYDIQVTRAIGWYNTQVRRLLYTQYHRQVQRRL